jgi:hypothetical protein
MSHDFYHTTIDACLRGAQECEHVLDTCVKDPEKLAERLRLTRDCADICWTTAAFLSRGSQFAGEICRMCAEVAEACGAECAQREMEDCQRCADVCRQVTEECRRVAGVTA